MEVCTAKAISINEKGIVLINSDLCTGCRECIEACNFNAMQFDKNEEIVVKCDLCIKRLERKKQPSCVSICPTSCIYLDKKH
jgi:Fe-S-cluster-containing dehydrogenase component